MRFFERRIVHLQVTMRELVGPCEQGGGGLLGETAPSGIFDARHADISGHIVAGQGAQQDQKRVQVGARIIDTRTTALIAARATALLLASTFGLVPGAIEGATSPKTPYTQVTSTNTLPPTARREAADAKRYTSLVFYVTAHEDDWQLFRGQQAYNDLVTPTKKVVFIYMTAGDAGQTNGWWEARERGALAAVREALPVAPMTTSIASFNRHPILRYACRNSVSYFFRLPDGNDDGNGFPAFHNQSLSGLRDSDRPITAVDGSTTYNSWRDLWQTVKAAIDFEATDVQPQFTPVVNAADYDSVDLSDPECETHSKGRCDPCEHADHKATADALRNFVSEKYDRAWWVSYDTMHRPINLSGRDYEHKKDLFFAYGKAVLRETTLNGAPVKPLIDEWDQWGERNYFRTTPAGTPDVDSPVCGSSRGQ